MFTRFVSIIALVLGLSAWVEPESVTLPSTQAFTLRAKNTCIHYRIWVALPAKYKAPHNTTRYSVIYLLDPTYTFPIVRGIVRHLSDRNLLPDMIIVGIGYSNDDSDQIPPRDKDVLSTYKMNRTRDYTPIKGSEDEGYGSLYNIYPGAAPAFAQFIHTQLIPAIDTRYRTNGLRTLVGHSYGGLFVVWLYLTHPQRFGRYIAVSPSLWYGNNWLVQYLATHFPGPNNQTQLYMAAGSGETQRLIKSVRTTYHLLKLHTEPGKVVYEYFPREIHNTIFPIAFTHALQNWYT